MLKHGQGTVLIACTLIIASETYAQNWAPAQKKITNENELGQPLFDRRISLDEPSLVNFWATWCAPCIKEIPDLNAASQSLDHQVILVNVGESIESIEKFASENPQLELGQYAVVTQGFEFQALQTWKIRGLPTTFLISDREAIWKSEGILPWADAEVQADINRRLEAQ